MRQGITNFQAIRLTQARESVGLTKVALANFIKVSSAAVSKWESGKQYPEENNLSALSNFFNLPMHWFLKEPILNSHETPYFFRSNSTATKTARNIAKRKLEDTSEISSTLQKWVDLPKLSLPELNEKNFLNIDNSEIEELAIECRSLWSLGDAPIQDLVLAMESAGIICIRDEIGYAKMDGVSHWNTTDSRPYVFISSDKANGIRNRFDAAHELGHLILHRNTNEADYKKYYKEIEQQANLFAGAFLMPSTSFARNIALTTLDGLLSIKPRWKVSLAAMIMRCAQLGIIDNEKKTKLFKGRSARGWVTKEPYDDMTPEFPRILQRSIKMIIDSGITSKMALLDELAISAELCEKLCNLNGYFSIPEENSDNLITLKFKSKNTQHKQRHQRANIVNFPH